MKNRKIRIIVLLIAGVAIAAAFGLYVAHAREESHDEPPVISCSTDKIEASINVTDEELLQGVTAYDSEDGDVTSSIVIESISQFVEKNTRIVTYAAFDSKNHVSKATRTLVYTDYIPPRFELTGSLIFRSGMNVNVLKYVKANDCIDGDISYRVKVTLMSNSGSLAVAGTHDVRFKVTNSAGDTAYLDTTVDIYNDVSTVGKYRAEIQLKQYILYIPVGGRVDAKSFLRGVSYGNESMPISEYGVYNVHASSDVDTKTPGYYLITYTTTTPDDMYSGMAKLVVVIYDPEE